MKSRRLTRLGLALAIVVTLIPTADAAEKKSAPRTKWIPQGELDQDFSFQNACIGAKFPTNNVANKGVALKIGNDAYVCFDTDLLRV
ncbi:MAG: hypothetical protein ABIV39_12325, partial [Verrucomicrobiota bacterium]